ncbi:methylaspartate ammonia-lyase [Natronobacterium gregoryi]|uniref:methylaspartate ammonia-lyase n=2 Tax=Natronobacterium gregoryi TaxID=44930 RepID=L0AL26_NATGS|nr:methylaspartate ammonia-lyase [Natronobacterium gregoryi]AFZ74506.1 methylaspartate ammonia-lyase [Natronobacterium gregoryi SP2]ELY72420.1 methylaspartate ammonia-lyase [Natronobacterium gregoryi SP2]PLK21748.1 methylaspartate ammonia-lyase [Natronobacterium gregoryi SP2]SFI98169.1 methylaspartate ammonia-lyase [Natronobacterium gregoryi]
MKLTGIHATPGYAGFFFDDQRAIKQGAKQDGFTYEGEPVTDGFEEIRQAGETLIVDISLEDGSTIRGDCAAVQYSGAGGRDPLFQPEEYAPVVEGPVADELVGRDATDFLANAELLEELAVEGKRLHTAIRYGVSQALLGAAAKADGTTKTDVLADALGTDPATEPVPVFGQSGDDRYTNTEKMFVKGVPVLPHALINSVEKIGEDGETLVEYVEWLTQRSQELGPDDYEPRFHIDVYGMIGEIFGPPYDRDEVVDYFVTLEEAAAPYPIQIEGPMDAGNRKAQIEEMVELREGLEAADVAVDVVADEWCNTFEDVQAFVDAGAADLVQIKTPDLGGIHRSGQAVRYCEGTNTRAYLGGTCNETATSSRACAHVALATDAAQVLAKPGMGFDEGYMIVENEMRRTIARRKRDQQLTASDEVTADD